MHAKKIFCYSYANTLSSFTTLVRFALPSNRSPMHLNAWKKLQQLEAKKKPPPQYKIGEHSARGKKTRPFYGKWLKAQKPLKRPACAAPNNKKSSSILLHIWKKKGSFPTEAHRAAGLAHGQKKKKKKCRGAIEIKVSHGQRDLVS